MQWELNATVQGASVIKQAYESLGHLVRMQIWFQQVSRGARDPAFMTISQAMPFLLVHEPQVEQQGDYSCDALSMMS